MRLRFREPSYNAIMQKFDKAVQTKQTVHTQEAKQSDKAVQTDEAPHAHKAVRTDKAVQTDKAFRTNESGPDAESAQPNVVSIVVGYLPRLSSKGLLLISHSFPTFNLFLKASFYKDGDSGA